MFRKNPCLSHLLALLLLAALAGCGGGGGSAPPNGTNPPPGGNNPPPGGNNPPTGNDDKQAPSLVVDFPPVSALVEETAAPSLTVRGRASDDTELDEVRINDVPVVTNDGFASWHADVPLETGKNEIEVTAVDAAGNATTRNVSIERVPFIPKALSRAVIDEQETRIYVTDYLRKAVLSVDLSNGAMALLSGAGKGDGPAFSFPRDLVIDAERNRLIVADPGAGSDTLFAVDMVTGDRTVLANSVVGEGPPFNPDGIALDANDSNRVYLTDRTRRMVIAVSLDSGDREVLSYGDANPDDGDDSVGSGDPFIFPRDVVHDAANGRLLIAAATSLIAVDLVSGDRTRVGSLGVAPVSLALDVQGNRLLYGADSMRGSIRQFDLDSNEAMVLSDVERGAGPQLLNTTGVTGLDAGGRVHAVDSVRNRIVSVDLASGDRAFLPSPAVGEGEPLVDIRALSMDALNDRLLVTNRPAVDDMDVVSVGVAEGMRDKLHDLDAGTDVAPITSVVDTVFDAEAGMLWILTGSDALFSVDMGTGARQLVSGDGAGQGPAFDASGLAVDFIAQRAWVTDSNADALFAVGLADGMREIVSDAERGHGPEFGLPGAVVLSDDGQRVFVMDSLGDRIVEVDAASGDRADLAELEGDTRALFRDGENLVALTSRGLYVFEPATSDARLISGRRLSSDDSRGRGIAAENGLAGRDLACDDKRKVCYLASTNPGGVVAVDMVSGDRAIIAR